MSYVDNLARQKLDELEALEKDQEREFLEEKKQADEAETRLKETRQQMTDLRAHLEPEPEAEAKAATRKRTNARAKAS